MRFEGGTDRALVVDDTEDMRLLLSLVLRRAGMAHVDVACDGREGYALWLASPDPYDWIILDQRMPGMSGLDLAERILGDDPSARVVLFTAYLDDDVRRRASALKVTCISKERVNDLPELLAA